MYLLEALDHYKKEKLIKEYSEYELLCRIHLTGVLDLGCIYLQFWEIPPSSELRGVRSIYLKTISAPEDITKELPPKDQQYYIPGGLPSEVTILMTLFTRAHFVLSRILRLGGILIMNKYASEEDVARGDIDGKTLALESIEPYFHMLGDLERLERESKLRRLEPFMLAARFYHLAFSLIDRDDTLAYISLVSAIEALLHDYDIDNIELEDWNENAADLIKKAVSTDKFAEIKQAILIKPTRIKQRFIGFIKEHLTDKFWLDPTRPNKIKSARFKDISDVEKYLGRIYDVRSSALHEGRPFPPSVRDDLAECPFSLGVKVGWRKEWKEKELIPSVRTFERIVHHVLIEYLRRESEKGKVLIGSE